MTTTDPQGRGEADCPVTRLSGENAERFVEYMNNPPEPNQALKDAAASYRRMFSQPHPPNDPESE